MKGGKPREREVRDMIAQSGLEMDPAHPMKMSGCGHIKVWLRRPGETTSTLFVLSQTPSDPRANRNNLALMRRYGRGQYEGHTRATDPEKK
jgi:hypothetical protein